MSFAPKPWTDADVERMVALWNSGKSASEIGRLLGVSRNAVIGKVHRTAHKYPGIITREFASRPEKVISVKRIETRLQRRAITPPKVIAPKPAAEKPAAPVIPIARAEDLSGPTLCDRPRNSCCYPVGADTGADQQFCCEPVTGDRPYCEHHRALMFVPLKVGSYKRIMRLANWNERRAIGTGGA